jgi:hypothetical protein
MQGLHHLRHVSAFHATIQLLTPPTLRQTNASDYNFVVNFIGDINARKDSVEKVEAAKLGKNDKRR